MGLGYFSSHAVAGRGSLKEWIAGSQGLRSGAVVHVLGLEDSPVTVGN
jgi:hypothetical protein